MKNHVQNVTTKKQKMKKRGNHEETTRKPHCLQCTTETLPVI